MADTIELSEAIRSILGEENKEKQLDSDVDSRSEENVRSSTLNQPSSVWDPYHAPGKGSGICAKLKRSGTSKHDFRSPPKKRRHINEVIILRNPRRKSKTPDATKRIGDLLKQKTETPKRTGTPDSTLQSPLWSSQNSQSSLVTSSSELSQSLVPELLGCKSVNSETSRETGSTDGRIRGDKERDATNQLKHPGKRKKGDDSLTNITWLRRMSAPDLDPQTLQVSKVSDPRHERPPYSYSTLIQFAISTASSGRMTLREIYHWIEVHFPYFRTAKLGWRNSIRHNLSLHKIFIREPPVGHGQPAFWTLRPGTVVRLPEKTMFVAKKKSNSQDSSSTKNSQQTQKTKATHKRPTAGTADEKKRKEQYILPRPTAQPLALVPVPIFLSGDTGAKLITSPATGEPILSPIPINLLPDAQLKSLFPATQEKPGQRKMVRIAPKVTTAETVEKASNNSLNLQVSYPNATFSNTSALRDSGFSTDGEGTFQESLIAPSSQDLFGASPENRKHLPIKKRGSPWNGITSSTPHQNAKRAENVRPLNDMPDLSIFDELPSFDSTPSKTPSRRGKRKLTTPSRIAPCPDWLSPIRGLTPFKFGDEFTNLREDLNVTPPRTGLTPKNRHKQASTPGALCTPKSLRSPALGSLGDFGLSGLTPERISDIQNQSFGKMFGGDMSFEMDSDGFWSMMSPS